MALRQDPIRQAQGKQHRRENPKSHPEHSRGAVNISQMHELVVPPTSAGRRLDLFLTSAFPHTSRNQIQHWIHSGLVLVNGKTAPPGHHLRGEEHITLELPAPESTALAPEHIPLQIVYEDDHIIVINKPPGLVVHPGAGRKSGTLVNALLAHTDRLSTLGGPLRPGIVHRLDKDTSGLLVVAKDDPAHLSFTRILQAREVHRHYLALVWGEPRREHFSIQAAIGRKPSERKQMAVSTAPGRHAREAQTEIEVLEKFGEISLVEARLATGRTHQVRVHLSFVGHPLVGDRTYGLRLARGSSVLLDQHTRILVDALPGQALHSWRLAFPHPISGEPLEFRADPPEHFARLLSHLRERQGMNHR